MAQQNYVPYQVPADVDQRVQMFRERIAAKRGVSVTKVSKAGDTLRALLAVVEAAEQLSASQPEQAQP
jgi:hypothetical protein